MLDLKTWGPMTVLLVAVALIVVLAGAVAVATGNYDGDFRQWMDDLKYIAGAAGVLGVGRGVLEGKKAEADARIEEAHARNAAAPLRGAGGPDDAEGDEARWAREDAVDREHARGNPGEGA